MRRVRIERLGWPRYLAAAGATAVDRRRNDIEATREALFRFPDGDMLLVSTCPSTGASTVWKSRGAIRTCGRPRTGSAGAWRVGSSTLPDPW